MRSRSLEPERGKPVLSDTGDRTAVDARLDQEEMSVDKPQNESRPKLSDLQPAELGGDRQQFNISTGQPCGGHLLLLGKIPVLSGDGGTTLGVHIHLGSPLVLISTWDLAQPAHR
jgi:hypothetical protein